MKHIVLGFVLSVFVVLSGLDAARIKGAPKNSTPVKTENPVGNKNAKDVPLANNAPEAVLDVLASKSPNDALLKIDVKEFFLPNGLRTLVVERRQAPILSCFISFKVGSVDENVGQTGVSHLVEHLLYNGTQRMGTKNYTAEKPLLEELDALMEQKERAPEIKQRVSEIQQKLAAFRVEEDVMEIYRRHGATNMNGATSTDVTCYYASLPADRLDLWLMLEADRFSNPVFRDFYRERDVVLEERRLTETCSPMGQFFTTLNALAYQVHPNRNPVIGWGSDIANITRKEALDYFYKYYVPNNATIVLVGDITVEKAKQQVSKYFGVIPRGPQPPEVREVEPVQQGEKRASLSLEMRPTMAIAYHTAAITDKDTVVLDLMTNLLADGRTSRLYKKIVMDSRMANDVDMNVGAGRYPGLTFFFAIPEEGHTYVEIEKAFYEEMERLKTEPVKNEELDILKKRMLLNYLRSLESNNAIAEQLSYCASVCRWQYLLEKPAIIRSITPEDIMRIAKKYFTRENRAVLTVDSKSETPPKQPAK